MSEQKQVLRYYKRRMYRGRTQFARLFDFVALRIVFFVAAYLWFLNTVTNQLLALILSVIALMMFIVVLKLAADIRLDRFIRRERERLSKKSYFEQMVLLDRSEFLSLCRAYLNTQGNVRLDGDNCTIDGHACLIFTVQQLEPLKSDSVLHAYHLARKREMEHVLLFCTSAISAEAEAFKRRLSAVDVRIVEPEKLVKVLLGSEEAEDAMERVDRILESEIERERTERKRTLTQPFAPGRARRYLFAGAALIGASFITSYALYYRILAGVCFMLAGTSFWLNRNAKQDHKDVNA